MHSGEITYNKDGPPTVVRHRPALLILSPAELRNLRKNSAKHPRQILSYTNETGLRGRTGAVARSWRRGWSSMMGRNRTLAETHRRHKVQQADQARRKAAKQAHLTPAQRKVLTHVLTNSAKHSPARPYRSLPQLHQLRKVLNFTQSKPYLKLQWNKELKRRQNRKIYNAQQKAIQNATLLIQAATKKRKQQLTRRRINNARKTAMRKAQARGRKLRQTSSTIRMPPTWV